MTTRFFTLQEANSLLPKIKPLMSALLDHQAHVARSYQSVAPMLEHAQYNVGDAEASALIHEFMAIERLVEQIRSYGCQVKDIRVGLVDFLAEIDGREVYLCWRYGEEEIRYYHDLDAGFNGRRPISEGNDE